MRAAVLEQAGTPLVLRDDVTIADPRLNRALDDLRASRGIRTTLTIG